ncbi:tyrosine--tRNA ligase [bacterium]|nr:tyrosine--tRNA ligase [bacterium]
MKEIENQLKILSRNCEKIIPADGLKEKLLLSKKENRPLKIKFGADPSAPDLHLGHLVILRKLKEFQDLGHQIIIIIGDFTAQIGDPSGRKKTRPQLSEKEVKENAKTYLDQLGKILDLKKTKVFFNSQWFSKMKLKEVIELASYFSVAQILERNDFKERFKNQIEIKLHEFLYPLLQGYDSFVTEADIEIGGTDQEFNMLVGRFLQQAKGKPAQIVITMPLIEGLDGKRKMSKSYGNYIGIYEEPREIYGKVMSLPDKLMIKYFRLLTDFSEKEIKDFEEGLKKGKIHPRNLKAKLAFEIVKELWGEKKAQKAQDWFESVFKKKEMPKEVEEIEVFSEKINLPEILTEKKILPSRSEVKRLILQGAIKILEEKGNKRVEIPVKTFEISFKKSIFLKIGKKKFLKLTFKKPS